MPTIVTAAVILIGDEILSGRTQDTNLKTIADFLNPLGVEVREGRMIPDVHATIVATVNELRANYDYVFTTGGIGPTHDDITADAVAAAFGRTIGIRDDAVALMRPWYEARGYEMTEGRLRMARIPAGAELILNPVSVAPGFQIENVFVMAGVPSVVRGMLQDTARRIRGGAVVHSRTVRMTGAGEGQIAAPLAELARATADASLGSYPFARLNGAQTVYGTNLVARSRDKAIVDRCVEALMEIVRAQGVEPEIDPKD